MILSSDQPVQLTYCLNVHKGESWAENLAAIGDFALPVRERVCPDRAFGLGLRLSNEASIELSAPEVLAEFKGFLDDNSLYAFTINGFPYGTFHDIRVKENVYLPDWRTAERRDYTIRLADILAELLPDGVDGSISTVPVAYKSSIQSEADIASVVENLSQVATHLDEIFQRTGKLVHIGLEPEPDCYLETTDEVILFFQERLAESISTEILRRHIGVCFDACHLALQFEDLQGSMRRLKHNGVLISKVHVSAAMKVAAGPELEAQLGHFSDEVYLHQVKVRDASGVISSYPDLPAALAHDSGAPTDGEWRVHYHVPLYFEGGAGLRTTADELTPEFFRTVIACGVGHLEIETYTFNVLPESVGAPDVVTSISDEFAWLFKRLKAFLPLA